MIELNLVPDVKQELIKAQQQRTLVISLATIVGIVAVAIVAILAIYVFGIQTGRGYLVDRTIQNENTKLMAIDGLDSALTVQSQLAKLDEIGKNRKVDSRVFDVLLAIAPEDASNIGISKVSVDMSEDVRTISIEAQALAYPDLEAFRKTILATKFSYSDGDDETSVPLAETVNDSNRSFGEDATGKKILRFTLTFQYPEKLFDKSLAGGRIVSPSRTNVTDSFVGIPDSLITSRANDTTEGGN